MLNNKKPPKELLKKYTEDGEYPVKFDTKVLEKAHFKAIGDDFLSRAASAKKVDKTIRRTLIRHNSEKVARHIMRIFYS